jgi:hypothetical protein
VRTVIRKVNGRWTSSRQAYGFARVPDVRTHRSWDDALRSLRPRPGTPAIIADPASYPSDGLAPLPRWTPLEWC